MLAPDGQAACIFKVCGAPNATLGIATVAAAAVCTATASAVPASGTEDFTITITDSFNGDYVLAKLTLGTP